MIFIKTNLTDDIEIKVDLYGDEFRSLCPMCGKEHDITIEDVAQVINQGGDLAGTSIWCGDCSRKSKGDAT